MTESTLAGAPERALSSPQITVAQDIKAGLLAMGIAVLCLLPPGIHFISGPLGPAIGGFFASARIRARGRHVLFIGLSIGVGVAIASWFVAAMLSAFGLIRFVRFEGGHPSMDQSSVLVMLVVDVIAFLYSTGMGCLGAYLGGRGDGG